MKDQIKEFYENHKAGCNFIIAGGVVACAVVLNRKVNGYKPKTVDYYTRDDGASMIVVGMNNGKFVPFTKLPEVA